MPGLAIWKLPFSFRHNEVQMVRTMQHHALNHEQSNKKYNGNIEGPHARYVKNNNTFGKVGVFTKLYASRSAMILRSRKSSSSPAGVLPVAV